MKKFSFTFLMLIALHYSCGSGRATTSSHFSAETQGHKRIAVLPIHSKIKLKEEDRLSYNIDELKAVELAQAVEVQNAVETYLISKDLTVTIQSASITNKKLKDHGINLSMVNETDVITLSKILGVDALVSGEIETEKPMDEQLAQGIDLAKGLERTLLGSSILTTAINTSTNKGWCSLALYEGSKGDRLWSYKNNLQMGVGSTTSTVIDKMMRDGAKKFPYKK